MRQLNERHRWAALLSLAVGLLIALAANLTYAVPRGPVSIGLGLIAPLVLPLTLYLRTTFDADGWWQIGIRELATLLVAGPAAAISYSHTFSLVLGAGEPWILAILAPLSSDGLAGMATLALHQQRKLRTPTTQPVAATPVAPERPVANETAPSVAPKAPRVLAPVGGTLRDRVRAEYLRIARETLADGGSLDDIVLARIDRTAGASAGYAKKIVNGPGGLRAELEAQEAVG